MIFLETLCGHCSTIVKFLLRHRDSFLISATPGGGGLKEWRVYSHSQITMIPI